MDMKIKSTKASPLAATALAMITALAATILAHTALTQSLGYDELWHVTLGSLSPAWFAFLSIANDTHPPLYYLLLRPLTHAGSDPIYPRLLSVIPALLTLPLFFFVQRKVRINGTVAITTTFVLGISFAFLSMGVMVRSYSLAILLVLLALWFWLDMLPGVASRPSRRSAILSLAAFAAAFWSLYVTVFATVSIFAITLLLMLLHPATGRATLANWRRYSRWPEWAGFILAHLLLVGWFVLSARYNVEVDLPGHVVHLTRQGDQLVGAFLSTALRSEWLLFSPLPGLPVGLVDDVMVMLALIMAGLTWFYARRGNIGATLLAAMPLLMTALLALLGAIGKYPFGGELRHQYILYPFLLLTLPLLLNAVWKPLRFSVLRLPLLLLVGWIAVTTSQASLQQAQRLGETPSYGRWADEFEQLFNGASDVPVVIPHYSFYSAFVNRWVPGIGYRNAYQCEYQGCSSAVQGWGALLEPWPAFQRFVAKTDDGRDFTLYKSHQWVFPAVPTLQQFHEIRSLMNVSGHDRLRIFSPASKPDEGFEHDDTRQKLADAAAVYGYRLIEFTPVNDSLLWTIERDPGLSSQPTPEAANAPSDSVPPDAEATVSQPASPSADDPHAL